MQGGGGKRVSKRRPASLRYINWLVVETDVPKEVDNNTNRSSVGGAMEGHVIKLHHLGIPRHAAMSHLSRSRPIHPMPDPHLQRVHSILHPPDHSHYVVHDVV